MDLDGFVIEQKLVDAEAKAKADAQRALRDIADQSGNSQTDHVPLAAERLVGFLADGGRVDYFPSADSAETVAAARFTGMMASNYALEDGSKATPAGRPPANGSAST